MSSTRVIWKHVISHPETGITLGPDDRILTCATQHGEPCVWIEHSAPPGNVGGGAEIRVIRAVPTGSSPQPGDEYIGTCHDVAGAGLVFHLYLTLED